MWYGADREECKIRRGVKVNVLVIARISEL